MKVLGVIPAPVGSKNSPLHALRLLAGKPLLAYTAEAALAARRPARVVLCTADASVAESGRSCGLEVLRCSPKAAAPLQIVRDALRQTTKAGEAYDAVCVLDIAAPFRLPEEIDRCIELLERSGSESVVTVVPVPQEYHPQAVYLRGKDGSLRRCTAAPEPAYRYDGSVCVIGCEALRQTAALPGDQALGYPVDPVRSVSLERAADWGRAEHIAKLGTHRGTTARIAPLTGRRAALPAGWSALPAMQALVGDGIAPLGRTVLSGAAVATGRYLEPARKPAVPPLREFAIPFATREALLPGNRTFSAREFLAPVPSARIAFPPKPGHASAAARIEDPFRPHPELLPGIAPAETPFTAALAARGLAQSPLDPPAPLKARDTATRISAGPAAAPVHLTGELGKAAGTVRPVQPFVIGKAPLAPAGQNAPRPVQFAQAPALPFAFGIAAPRQPASNGLIKHQHLLPASALRRQGKPVSQPSQAAAARIDVASTHAAELFGASRLTFGHQLSQTPATRVWAGTRKGAAVRQPQGWTGFARESAVTRFRSIESAARSARWPEIRTISRLRQPAKVGRPEAIAATEPQKFSVSTARIPVSAVSHPRMSGAPLAKTAQPAIRSLASTPAALISGGFTAPDHERLPVFSAGLKARYMPPAVFRLFEFEDHDDFSTWNAASGYPAIPELLPHSWKTRFRGRIDAAGPAATATGPYPGKSAPVAAHPDIRAKHPAALVEREAQIAAMDFAAIAEASTSWRASLKKTAGIFG